MYKEIWVNVVTELVTELIKHLMTSLPSTEAREAAAEDDDRRPDVRAMGDGDPKEIEVELDP